jgi:hypothetical protein
MTPTREPKITKVPGTTPGETEELETHPAYGQISVTRVQGHAKLYGSAIEDHGTFICIKIKHSKRRFHLLRYWFSSGRNIVEVHLSQAQYAEFLTTPNMGEGVPCTLSRLGGESVPGIAPSMKTEVERVVRGFVEDQAEIVDKLRAKVDHGLSLLRKSRIGKGDREHLRGVLEYVMREVEANRPFAVESFKEAAEKVVVAGKAEIEAFTMSAVMRLGLSSIRQLHALAVGEKLQLPAHEEEEA